MLRSGENTHEASPSKRHRTSGQGHSADVTPRCSHGSNTSDVLSWVRPADAVASVPLQPQVHSSPMFEKMVWAHHLRWPSEDSTTNLASRFVVAAIAPTTRPPASFPQAASVITSKPPDIESLPDHLLEVLGSAHARTSSALETGLQVKSSGATNDFVDQCCPPPAAERAAPGTGTAAGQGRCVRRRSSARMDQLGVRVQKVSTWCSLADRNRRCKEDHDEGLTG